MSIKNNFIFRFLAILVFMTSVIWADISGTVFRDLPVNGTTLNSYGVKDTNELGVKGITVTAFPENISTVTDENGSWSLATTKDSRIEFSAIPSYLKESESGGVKNASIQFIKNGETDVTFGLHNINEYFDSAKPEYVTSIHINGSNLNNEVMDLVRVNYTVTGLNQDYDKNSTDKGDGSRPIVDAKGKDLGSVWGEAYDPKSAYLYISALMKRHSGFASGNTGRIWIKNYNNLNEEIGYIDINGINNIDLGSVLRNDENNDNSLGDDPTQPNTDKDAYAKAGKISFGDIEFDRNNRVLWAVNLNEQAIIRIDVSGIDLVNHSVNKSKISQYKLSSLQNTPSCTNGIFRPWALSIHNGRGYLGGVCDASIFTDSTDESQSDYLKAYVLSFNLSNPTDGLKEEFVYADLGKKRPTSLGLVDTHYYPWNDFYHDGEHGIIDADGNYDSIKDSHNQGKYTGKSYNQPIFSDIEFDEYNNMYWAFMDRYSLQVASSNYSMSQEYNAYDVEENLFGFGMMKKLCWSQNDSKWEMESYDSETCPATTLVSNVRNRYEEKPNTWNFFEDYSGDNKSHTDGGALALIPGSKQVLRTVDDPHPNNDVANEYFHSNGVETFSTITGGIENWYAYYNNKDVSTKSQQFNSGKAAGLGDLELLTTPAPIEVGDRVWKDENSNGIQDADESGLAEVSVTLTCGDDSISAITDVDGYYIFSNDTTKTSTDSHVYNVSFLEVGRADCKIVIPNVTGATKQAVLVDNNLNLTVANIGEGENNNSNDSDGVFDGDNADAFILATDISVSGANNHSFDFGFSPKPTVSIGSLIWEDLNNDGLQDDSENGIKDVNVTLLDENGTVIDSVPMQTTTENGGYYFSGLDEGSYSVLVTPPSGYRPCTQQTTADNDDNEDDSNIKEAKDGGYVSGKFSLEAGTEPSESNGKIGTDDADDANDENGNMTVDFCFYKPASLGDYVWYDDDKSGTQDANESGVEGVTVTLLKNCDATQVEAIKLTDANGKYLFDGLYAGDYCVEFSNLPADYMPTTKGGTGADDSDPSTTAPYRTELTTLDVGENDLTWDMGIYPPAPRYSLGDKVWIDNNKDGVQDEDEKGLTGVKVKLYNNADCTGIEVKSMVTDESGNYTFTNLEAGTYCIEFTEIPTKHRISPNTGDDETTNSDADENGKIKNINLTGNDLTEDMGLYAPASIGDRVWYDVNKNGIQDNGEEGVEDVTVTLYAEDCTTPISKDIDGGVIAPIKTSSEGFYSFANLTPAKYCLGFSEIPSAYEITARYKGDNNEDSDVYPATGKTESTTLTSGENDTTWDMGIYEKTVVVEPDPDPTPDPEPTPTPSVYSTLGDYVWYDDNHNGLQDEGEKPVSNVKVVLYHEDCESKIAETRSDSTGHYQFTNLESSKYCIGFEELPTGYQFTPEYDNTGSGSEVDCNVDPGTGKTPVISLPESTTDNTWDMGIIPKCVDEQGRHLLATDDEVKANTEGSTTTINVIENDEGNIDDKTVKLVSQEEGETLWQNGTAVEGTSLTEYDEIKVPGEGVWRVDGEGNITFTAEDGFTGVPTPIYYVVKCRQGTVSNLGQVKIVSECVCNTYETKATDSVASMNLYTMLLMLLLTSSLALLFRKEFNQ